MLNVEYREENETTCSGYTRDDGNDGEYFLRPGCIMSEFTQMSKPSLEEKACCKGDDGGGTHCDE